MKTIVDTNHISTSWRVKAAIMLFILLLPHQSSFAAKPQGANLKWPDDAALLVERSGDTNTLTWDSIPGTDVFGYDIYFSAITGDPGSNPNRITTGANDGIWIDLESQSRCFAENYYIRAYSRGRKSYSPELRASAENLCATDDAIPPTATFTYPTASNSMVGLNPQLSGTATDVGGSGIQSITVAIQNETSEWVSLDGFPLSDQTDFKFLASLSGPSGSLSTNWTLDTGLMEGSFTAFVYSVDAAGNEEESFNNMIIFTVQEDGGPGPGPGGGEDTFINGYPSTMVCGLAGERSRQLLTRIPDWSLEFNENEMDIHQELQGKVHSRYAWRGGNDGTDPSQDVIINNESQFYMDVLDFEYNYRDQWSPFVRLVDEDDEDENGNANGYLAIRAAVADEIFPPPTGPIVNGQRFAGKKYISGVLTTRNILPPDLSLNSNSKVKMTIRSKMPLGQGAFPAGWLNHSSFRGTQQPEIDIYEYLGQTPNCRPDDIDYGNDALAALDVCSGNSDDDWKRVDTSNCPDCQLYGRDNYDTHFTQYHNHHKKFKGPRKSLNNYSEQGAVYTNPDPVPWRVGVWDGCDIQFWNEFHEYSVEWSADGIVWYIDDIEVVRIDDNNQFSAFMPTTTESMHMVLNLALGSDDMWIGNPDTFSENAMAADDFKHVIDYVRVWFDDF